MTGVVFQRHPYLDALVEMGFDVHMVAAAARTLRQLETSPSHPPTTRPGWDGDLATCPKHGLPWVTPDGPDGYRRCTFYISELGASEDYGCPQGPSSTLSTCPGDDRPCGRQVAAGFCDDHRSVSGVVPDGLLASHADSRPVLRPAVPRHGRDARHGTEQR